MENILLSGKFFILSIPFWAIMSAYTNIDMIAIFGTEREFGMCTNGVNTGQFDEMMDQIADHIKLERRWAHKLAHEAGDAGFENTHLKLHEVQALLDDALAALDEAKDILEEDAEKARGVTVRLA